MDISNTGDNHNKQIVIEAHYYDLLEQYLERNNGTKNELDFILNEVNFYKDFIKEFEAENPTEDWEIAWKEDHLIGYKKYYNYFRRELERFDENDIKIAKNRVSETQSNVRFELKQVEVIELVKALILNGNVTGTQKDIIKEFGDFFKIKINNPNKTLQDIKNRNNGSESLFVDKLKLNIFKFVQK